MTFIIVTIGRMTLIIMTISRMTITRMTIIRMAFIIMTISRITFSRVQLNRRTLSRMAFGRAKHGIMKLMKLIIKAFGRIPLCRMTIINSTNMLSCFGHIFSLVC